MSQNNPSYAKHTPATDALDTLGMIHFRQEKRDAIHLAVDPVIAAEDMKPGQRIGIIEGHAYPAGQKYAAGYQDENGLPVVLTVPCHGIVDPFLPAGPMAGDRFWFVMNPRMVQSLRHVWNHPDFPEGE